MNIASKLLISLPFMVNFPGGLDAFGKVGLGACRPSVAAWQTLSLAASAGVRHLSNDDGARGPDDDLFSVLPGSDRPDQREDVLAQFRLLDLVIGSHELERFALGHGVVRCHRAQHVSSGRAVRARGR